MLKIVPGKIKKLRTLLKYFSYNVLVENNPESTNSIQSTNKQSNILIGLFHLNLHYPYKSILDILGTKFIDDMISIGILTNDNGMIFSKFTITSIHGYYFLYDFVDYKKLSYAYFGRDTLLLEKYLPYNKHFKAVLDIGTGTGFHAILLSKLSDKTIGSDISPDAVIVSKFNCILNNAEDKVTIIEGDLFQPFKGNKFDLIVSNPPFVPIPNSCKYPLCGDGGEDGLSFINKMLTEIPNLLTEKGEGIISAAVMGDEKGPFIIDKIRELYEEKDIYAQIFVLNRISKKHESVSRSVFLKAYNKGFDCDFEKEMNRIYDENNAGYLYSVIIELDKGRKGISSAFLFEETKSVGKYTISINSSLNDLYRVLIKQFDNKKYIDVTEIFEVASKLSKVLKIPIKKEIYEILGLSYFRLGDYLKSKTVFLKLKKQFPGNKNIDLHISYCRTLQNKKSKQFYLKSISRSMIK